MRNEEDWHAFFIAIDSRASVHKGLSGARHERRDAFVRKVRLMPTDGRPLEAETLYVGCADDDASR